MDLQNLAFESIFDFSDGGDSSTGRVIRSGPCSEIIENSGDDEVPIDEGNDPTAAEAVHDDFSDENHEEEDSEDSDATPKVTHELISGIEAVRPHSSTRSMTCSFSMRIQPFDTERPIDSGAVVPWIL